MKNKSRLSKEEIMMEIKNWWRHNCKEILMDPKNAHLRRAEIEY